VPLVSVSVLGVGVRVCLCCLYVALVPSVLAWCLYVPTVSTVFEVECIYLSISSSHFRLKLVHKMGGRIIGRLQDLLGLMYYMYMLWRYLGSIAPLSDMRQREVDGYT